MEPKGNGYIGYSMSVNAAEAYDNGQRPISKWNKADILAAVEEIAPEKAKLLEKINLKTLKEKLLVKTNWHHTSEFYNRTDFYAVDENAVQRLTAAEIQSLSTRKAPKPQGRTFRGDIEYLEWGGTRNHPKASKKKLENVNIEERGCFYIVIDDEGNELIRKKIGSNGTYVNDYERAARIEAEHQNRLQKVRDKSSEAAWNLYQKLEAEGRETSSSGHIYARGRKPSRSDYDAGVENFFRKGEQRLADKYDGGYRLETWDGTEWVQEKK